MTTQEYMERHLKVCRHDIAHLDGSSEQDIAAWVAAHLTEAVERYNEAQRVQFAESGDGIDAAEHALVAVQRWAQGSHFRGAA